MLQGKEQNREGHSCAPRPLLSDSQLFLPTACTPDPPCLHMAHTKTHNDKRSRAHQDEGAARAAQHVGERALEQAVDALVARHLAPAVNGAVVLALAASLQGGG